MPGVRATTPPAFYGFVAAYVLMLTVCWACYIRPARKRNMIGHI